MDDDRAFGCCSSRTLAKARLWAASVGSSVFDACKVEPIGGLGTLRNQDCIWRRWFSPSSVVQAAWYSMSLFGEDGREAREHWIFPQR